jgi:hypothetical protein
MTSKLKAFRVGDYDVYAATSLTNAMEVANEQCGDDSNEADDVRDMTDAELDHRYPAFDEDERPIEGETISVREMLAEHGEEPGWLCGSEY